MLKKPYYICLGLVLIGMILFCYARVASHDFINFDDNVYVSGNPLIKSGFSGKSLIWAFAATHSANWHPLTWLSHMLDVELYGLDAGGHHLTNVLFHIANTLLLFILLKGMTGALWPSAFAATLFALHPLHVESVAWISERKDVLSTFFGLLTLISYKQYARQRSRAGYMLALLFFILGLMSKPMLVTLPFVMLLLDYWPLGRVQFETGVRLRPVGQTPSVFSLLLEKVPFFILTAASCVVTYYAQQSGGAVQTISRLPLALRIENAIISYVAYIGKMFWPTRLAIFYPYPEAAALWKVVAAAAVLAGVFILAVLQIRRRPYGAVGWLWYVGTLVPVIGLVQVGSQAMADRYTYVPMIGLFIILAWGSAEIVGRWRLKPVWVAPAAGLLLLALMLTSRAQVGHWANSVTLYTHALEVTENNATAHNNLGKALNDLGRHTDAYRHYSEALRIEPHSAHSHVNWGSALLANGKTDEAIDHFHQALKLNPDFAEAYNNLGLALVRSGKIEQAASLFQIALEKNPDYENAAFNLNLASAIIEKIRGAVRGLRQAFVFDASGSEISSAMAELSQRKKMLVDAVNDYHRALSKQPGFRRHEAENIVMVSKVMSEYENLLPVLETAAKAQSACDDTCYHMACIYARKGMIQEARLWLQKAIIAEPERQPFFDTDPDLESIKNR
jgi:tetratricopeptide (TPR) repeat protein